MNFVQYYGRKLADVSTTAVRPVVQVFYSLYSEDLESQIQVRGYGEEMVLMDVKLQIHLVPFKKYEHRFLQLFTALALFSSHSVPGHITSTR